MRVILVYPRPPDNLGARATEFVADKKLPENFDLLLDPGYEFTNLYGLRWDAPNETAHTDFSKPRIAESDENHLFNSRLGLTYTSYGLFDYNGYRLNPSEKPQIVARWRLGNRSRSMGRADSTSKCFSSDLP